MSPSDLPWWGWILFAAGAGLVAKLLFAHAWSDLIVAQDLTKSQRAYAIGVAVSVVASIMALIGLVRFVKWIWDN